MSPLAAEIMLQLNSERRCAQQLAQATGKTMTEVYAALVELDDAGLASTELRKQPIPGFGLARYWSRQ